MPHPGRYPASRLGLLLPQWQHCPGTPAPHAPAPVAVTAQPALAAHARVVDVAGLAALLRLGSVRRLVHLRLEREAVDCPAAAMDGLLRVAALEEDGLDLRSLTLPAPSQAAAALAAEAALAGGGFVGVRHGTDGRAVRGWTWAPSQPPAALPVGTVVITGGLGGIGRALAQQVARQPGMRLVLCGRSAADAEAGRWLAALGCPARYVRADIADPAQAAAVLAQAAELGPLALVLHAAGVVADAPLAALTAQDFDRVLAPKAGGALALAAALDARGETAPLVLFSSLSGCFGNAGQGAYACANAWLDHIAATRPRTLSLAWPLWAEGGMAPPPATLARLAALGLQPLSTDLGVDAIARALALGEPAVAVVAGDLMHIADSFGLSVPGDDPMAHDTPMLDILAELAGDILKLPPERLDPARPLSNYGFDSITLTRLSNAIASRLDSGRLEPAVFLDHPTLGELAAFLESRLPVRAPAVVAEPVRVAPPPAASGLSLMERVIAKAPPPVQPVQPAPASLAHGIAIIGIGCRFPGAEGAVPFFRFLLNGGTAFTRVPAERWDWRAVDGKAAGRHTDCHFGAYLADVAEFDAARFAIPDAEADAMDPQHRLVLEAAWSALDDAGYGPDGLRGGRVGAFVAVQRQEYQARLAHGPLDASANTGTSPAMLANRLSHLFGFTGPSVAVDSACSGSLAAIHQAIRAIQGGDCALALAGGVNVVLAPESVIANRRMGLLTAADVVRPFDAEADGHLCADGAGLVLLKPVAQAVADGDFIYGIIRGIGSVHSGQSMFLTAPSPRGQAEAIAAALAAAGLDAADIDYVEGQGTAQPLVDGAELEAYRQAFRRPLPIGSLKGNVGNLESASGVAALIKVVLAMRAGTIPATVGFRAFNAEVLADGAPARVLSSAAPWPDRAGQPRRAGVHNFGFGGANLHVVVEQGPAMAVAAAGVVTVPLSADSPAGLRRLAAELAGWLEREDWRLLGLDAAPLADLAATKQSGRRALACRAVVLAASPAELIAALRRVAEGEAVALPAGHPASAWLTGAACDWVALRGGAAWHRLPLPATPFDRRRHWIAAAPASAQPVAAYYDAVADTAAALGEREEMNLLFAPFPQPVPGFSWLRVFFSPDGNPGHWRLFLDAQRAMKRRLFDRVGLDGVGRVMDIGCGFATDLLELARSHAGLEGRGFTIAPAQAQAAANRVQAAGLADRVRIDHADSARDDFAGPYDLMIGFEVAFHIEDKHGLFANMARNLAADGDILLIDTIADTVTEVMVPAIGQFTNTRAQYAEILAAHGLELVHAIDASPDIANFLADPDFEANLAALHAKLPDMAARAAEHRGWQAFGQACGEGLLRYMLLHVRKAASSAGLAARNRRALDGAEPYGAAAPAPQPTVAAPLPAGEVAGQIAAAAAELVGRPVAQLPRGVPFSQLGITSLLGLRLVERLNRALGARLRITDLFDHPTIDALAARLAGMAVQPVPAAPAPAHDGGDIAIIGLSGRFPGAEDAAALWRNLLAGTDSVAEVPPERWAVADHFDPDRTRPGKSYSKWGGFLPDIAGFDPLFFGLTPKEAEAMDPQQRLFLAECWRAIEDAGIDPASLAGRACGVVAGVQPSEYGDLADPAAFDSHAAQLLLGNAASILATRIAYLLDLKGPALAIDTACSSSLVAAHQACAALRAGEAETMLAGGVSLFLSHRPFVMMSKAGMLSPSGRCRAFAADADGIAVAEAVGVVVLRRLADAVADGQRVLAVIKGSAVNQDGATNGITAPSVQSQIHVARAALAAAGLGPDRVGMIEAHGTGTKLGDPIEVEALAQAYGGPAGRIALGSVKSNIGHASAAAGICGLIKAVLAISRGIIPPTLHAGVTNPLLRIEDTPFHLPAGPEEWPSPRVAAVHALSFCGTNCHVVLAEPPPAAGAPHQGGPLVFPLSARTPQALRRMAGRLGDYLAAEGAGYAPAAVAATLQLGRASHRHRMAVVAAGVAEAAAAFTAFAHGHGDCPQGEAGQGDLDDLLGGTAGSAFVAGLVADGDWLRLARLWCRGAAFDWQALWPAGRPAPVSLPGYDFDRMACWLPQVAHAAAPVVPDAARPCLLQPIWRPVSGSVAGRFSGRVVVIGDGSWAPLAQALGGALVAPEAAGSVDAGSVDAVVDVALDAALAARHGLWRALAAARAPRTLLVATPEGADGALAGGFAAALGGEVAQLASRWVMLAGRFDAETAAPPLAAELGVADGWGRVLWRDGARLVPDYAEVAAGPAVAVAGDGPILITGGLGGLGRALAGHLAAAGARCLLLTGRRPLEEGDARAAGVAALRAQGVTVEVFCGDLAGAAFADFVSAMRARHGALRGVVHAAGRVGAGARAFASRDWAQVQDVLAPKQAVTAVAALTASDPLAFFVVYGSVAAIVPRLAGGLVDYAAANAWLAAWAGAQAAQGRPVRALVWPNWQDSGLGAVSSDRYRALGFAPLSDAQGLALFDAALAAPGGEAGAEIVPARLFADARPAAWGLAKTPSSPSSGGGDLRRWLAAEFAAELKLPEAEIEGGRSFADYGVDSILLADLVARLERGLGISLDPNLLLEHRSLDALAAHLAGVSVPMPELPAPQPAPAPQPSSGRVAVIGLACDMPGAPDAAALWRVLEGGVDCITEVPAERWDAARLYDPAGGPGKSVSKWGGFIADAALFDAGYFNIAEGDAAGLDPLVRKTLEVAVQALRHAGYGDAEVAGRAVGVFMGGRMGDYGARAGRRGKSGLTGAAQNFIAAQLAQALDLRGPNLVVDTACSSSLTALHLACRSLVAGESALALAGGVDLLLDEVPYVALSAAQALSPDGRCRAFDQGANGFVPGEGAGMVVLKRLDDALADGDRVLAVIEGTAVNNDGRTMGTTTPNPQAQEAVIRAALAAAALDPAAVSYVETHGTATMIGDPIELKALGRALGPGPAGRCGVGSIKTNMGHLLSAAGIAGVIKVVLQLHHRRLVPSLHCARPNPRFDFAASALRPVRAAEDWQPVNGVRVGGVSAFGFGGTNVHAVLSDALPAGTQPRRQPLPPQEFRRKRYWLERAARGPLWLSAAPARVLGLAEVAVEDEA